MRKTPMKNCQMKPTQPRTTQIKTLPDQNNPHIMQKGTNVTSVASVTTHGKLDVTQAPSLRESQANECQMKINYTQTERQFLTPLKYIRPSIRRPGRIIFKKPIFKSKPVSCKRG